MNPEQERGILEAIAVAADSTAGERLAALAQLRNLAGAPAYSIAAEVQAMPTDRLDALIDDFLLADVAAAIFGRERGDDPSPLAVDPSRYPQTTSVVLGEIARIRTAAESEVEERVKARSRWLLEREIGLSSESLSDASGAETDETSDSAPESLSADPGAAPKPVPAGIDLSLGWPRRPVRRRRIG